MNTDEAATMIAKPQAEADRIEEILGEAIRLRSRLRKETAATLPETERVKLVRALSEFIAAAEAKTP